MKLRSTASIALVLASLAGCGGGGGGSAAHTAAPPSTPRVTLDLKGGGNETATGCGATHHFAVLPRGRPVRFSGDVTPVPSTRWKVKVKLKVCTRSTAREVAKVEATRDKSTGHFSGSARVAAGRYFARATLYIDGARAARSDKRHFVVR